ncbi:MAG TPA: universal stress protein [Candidatus Binatia bacterium]|jgi:nucleotide-binding universal stress UspA family protein
MKRLQKILVPTDLSEGSRRALRYACALATEEDASIVILHVANEFKAWEMYSDDFAICNSYRPWPLDRILSEATLDLNTFLEADLDILRTVPRITKRVLLGQVADQIVYSAEDEGADLIVMAPRREQTFRLLFSTSVTNKVMRMSPCPVLCIAPPRSRQPERGELVRSTFAGLRPKLVHEP